jgi:hypothetical protein
MIGDNSGSRVSNFPNDHAAPLPRGFSFPNTRTICNNEWLNTREVQPPIGNFRHCGLQHLHAKARKHLFGTVADSGRPVVAYSHEQIDAYNHSSERVKTRAHAALQAALERNQAVRGDAERGRDSSGDADTEAWEELLSTPPTSMAGIRALLAYILREVDDIHFVLGDLSVAALTSIEDALEAVNPAV